MLPLLVLSDEPHMLIIGDFCCQFCNVVQVAIIFKNILPNLVTFKL